MRITPLGNPIPIFLFRLRIPLHLKSKERKLFLFYQLLNCSVT